MFYGRGLPGITTSLECALRVVVKREIGFLPEAESLVPENCPLLRLQRKELASNAEAQTHTGISETTRSRQSSGGNLEREG